MSVPAGRPPTASTEAERTDEDELRDTSATKVTTLFVDDQLDAARRLMGDDFRPYGVQDSRATLDAFFDAHLRTVGRGAGWRQKTCSVRRSWNRAASDGRGRGGAGSGVSASA